MKVGFAMGGGGALSLSFIPILKGLQKEKIYPAVVSGVSMGAVIGALYCLYRDASKIEEIIFSYLQSPVIKDIKDVSGRSESGEKMELINKAFKFVKDMYLWNLRVIKNFLINPVPFMKLFEDMFENKKFEDLEVPLRVVSTDLRSCQPVVFKEGSLFPVITSTISMRGFSLLLNLANTSSLMEEWYGHVLSRRFGKNVISLLLLPARLSCVSKILIICWM